MARSSLKRIKLGFSVVGWVTLPSAVHSQGGHCRGYQEESDLEVVANNLDVRPQVFGLRASVDIVEQVPEKINVYQMLSPYDCIAGVVQGYIFLGFESTNRRSLFVTLRGAK